jgi:hypothetical protein
MSMVKVIQPHSQEFSEPVAALIKVSSRGLLGKDKSDLIKRAGAEFAHKLQNIKFAKDEVPVHLIAIGATEDYGPNRNGDGFKRACCENYHDTFVKHAKFYRDHINKNPAKSYGVVKASAYHEPMKRIELICGLNSTKEAAERNGGLVADKELEKLARGDDIGVSMACTIAYDVCSGCGNKARTRAEYCDSIENGGHCKSGGLRHNIGKCLSDGHVLHADNPHPRFFDISHVFRPADRIAYISGEFSKAAAAHTLSGAELAESLGVTAPITFDGDCPAGARAQLIALEKLAAAEQMVAHNAESWARIALAHSEQVQPKLNYGELEQIKLAEAVKALSDSGVILSVSDFLDLTVQNSNTKLATAISAALPNIFTELASAPDIVSNLAKNSYNPTYTASPRAKLWAEKIAVTRSVLPKDLEKRAYLAAIRLGANAPVTPKFQPRTKSAATNNDAINALARHYALYKIAAFTEFMKKYDADGLTATYCVMQNYVQ